MAKYSVGGCKVMRCAECLYAKKVATIMECRVDPPRMAGDYFKDDDGSPIQAVWPQVSSDDFCGSFEPEEGATF